MFVEIFYIYFLFKPDCVIRRKRIRRVNHHRDIIQVSFFPVYIFKSFLKRTVIEFDFVLRIYFVDYFFLLAHVQNFKISREKQSAYIFFQNPDAKSVISSNKRGIVTVAEKSFYSAAHFVRGFVCEGDAQYISGRYAEFANEISEPVG